MNRFLRVLLVACLVGLTSVAAFGVVFAQERPVVIKPESAKEKPPEKADAPRNKLAGDQQQVAEKYKRLEELLLRMAELNAATDPQRAALLRKAVAQSKERLISVQFDSILDLLQKEQLARASENQQNVDKDLRALLELLMSENRSKKIESEKARVREYLKRLGEIINQQKGIQGRTPGAGDPKGLADEQGKLAGKTGDLAKDVKANEEGAGKPDSQDGAKGPEKNAEGKNAQGKPKSDGAKPEAKGGDKSGGQPKKSESQGGKPESQQGSKGEKQGGQGKQGQGQDSSPKDPSQGQGKSGGQGKEKAQGQGKGQGQGEDSEQQSQEQQDQSSDQSQNPARKRLEAAQQRMREAQEKLKEAEKKGAADKQEEALRELFQAKAQLEEILRQLRDEEIERMLTMLEARFAKMLQMQRAVLEATVRLDKVPKAERNHSYEIEAGRLSSKEAEIDLDAEKAMTLLREDGTAVAFPEALDQLRQDIQQVVQRLAEAKTDTMTQGVEEEVISSLEEMIKALQKAKKDLEKKKQQPQQGSPAQGEGQDPPLVDSLSEIKMIRALQMRINTRTERYSKLVQGEQANAADLIEALRRLAERQEKVYKITRDLSIGKNR